MQSTLRRICGRDFFICTFKQVSVCNLLLYFSNEAVAGIVMSPAINRSSGATEEPLVETVVRFMDRKQPPEAQLEASRVLAYLYRSGH